MVFFMPIGILVLGSLTFKGSGGLMSLAGVSPVSSSIICASMVNRQGRGMAFFSFIGFLMLYAAIAFAGCVFLMGQI